MIRKYKGEVSTNRIGSTCRFEFEIDDEDLPEDPTKRTKMIDEIAMDELWNSGQLNWSYEEVDQDSDSQ